jgi:hypothetical protein
MQGALPVQGFPGEMHPRSEQREGYNIQSTQPNYWQSYNAADNNIRNAQALLHAQISHLQELSLMLTLVQTMLEDAIESDDPSAREDLQVRADNVLGVIDGGQARHTAHMRQGASQAASETLYLNGGALNGNGYTNGYSNGYTNGYENGYENGYADAAPASRSVFFQVGINAGDGWSIELAAMDTATLGINLDLTADEDSLRSQLADLQSAMETVVTERYAMNMGVNRLYSARTTLELNQRGTDDVSPYERLSQARETAAQMALEGFNRTEALRRAARPA